MSIFKRMVNITLVSVILFSLHPSSSVTAAPASDTLKEDETQPITLAERPAWLSVEEWEQIGTALAIQVSQTSSGMVDASVGQPALPFGYNVTQIAAGHYHTCALTTNGGVKCWGTNVYGGLGDGTTTKRYTPVDVLGLTNGISSIAAGDYHTCALTAGGGVKCWGNNDYGQLGDGTTTKRYTPVDVSGLTSGVSAIAAGWNRTCAQTTSGDVKCWGRNDYGQLGDGTTVDRYIPVDVSGLTSDVRAIVAGVFHTCALTTSGGVKCWGRNDYGQFGDGTTTDSSTPVDVSGLTSGVSAIATGYRFTCALTASGGVKCWGTNIYGQLGDSTTTNSSTPVDVSGLTSGVSALAVDGNHACALTMSGGAKCWGYNSYGELGDGTTMYRTTSVDVIGLTNGIRAIAAGYFHTCVITTSGSVKCWGNNVAGQLGDGMSTGNDPNPVPVNVIGLTSGVRAIAAGRNQPCALTASDGLKCWGYNGNGELGDGTTTDRYTPVDVSGLTSGVSAIDGGDSHICALTTSGGVKCWGGNSYGGLGNGTTTGLDPNPLPVDVIGLTSDVNAIAAGSSYTCALMTNGGIKCWGRNYHGELGDGTTTDRLTPVDVSGLTSGVSAIATGSSHTCALTTSGGLKCWGMNYQGELGNGTTTQRITPVDVSGLTSGVSAIDAGQFHTCALTASGGVKCWGYNISGELGDGTMVDRYTPVGVSGLTSSVSAIAVGYNHTCALMTSGGVKCWGNNNYGQLGDGTTTQRTAPVDVSGLTSGVSAIAAGASYTCALITSGGVKCWGRNTYGQLGDSTTIDSPTHVQVSGLLSSALPELSLSTNPSSFGTALSFTATLSGPVGLPGGTVQFTSDGVNLGSPVTLSSGSAASPMITTLPVGAHLIQAVYSGDTNYLSGSSAGVVQAISPNQNTGIFLYDGSVFSGSSIQFSQPGFINLSDFDFNDRASSISVEPGWSVKVYEHVDRNGSSRCMDHDMWDLSLDYYTFGDTGRSIDNDISSAEIYNNNTCRDEVKLYEYSNYGGSVIWSGGTGFSNGPNADSYSLEIPDGWSVKTWREDNKVGEMRCWASSVANLQDHSWHLAAQSIEVFDYNSCITSSTEDFVITVKTDNIGTSSDTEFTIPTFGGETHNYNVDCDDDGVDEITGATGDYTCNYPSTGTYTIRIKDNTGTNTGFPHIYFHDLGDKDKLLTVEQWGTSKWTSMNDAFSGCSNLVIQATDAPDLSNVTDMFGMFYDADSLNQNISHWDTSNVVNMESLFHNADIFNQDISGWVTTNVTNMSSMFAGATAFNQDISEWDTTRVTDMHDMFSGVADFNADISNWNVSNVVDLSGMFYEADTFNQNIGNWDTSNAIDLSSMFYGATAFNQDISEWVTTNVTNMSNMFAGATAFNQDISGWVTTHATDMHDMFSGASHFNADISNWDVSNVVDLSGMFYEADAFDQNIGNWNISRVTNLASLFNNADIFNQDISAWDTTNVTNMNSMFAGASNFNQPIAGWVVTQVTDMHDMFSGAIAFDQNISNWDISNITDMSGMFYGATTFNQDISGWNTGKVTNMSQMFQNATSFDQDLGNWSVSNLTSADMMFDGTQLSTTNYDALLIGWNSQSLQNGISFSGGNSTYCKEEAVIARENLISNYGWNITDRGKNCPDFCNVVTTITPEEPITDQLNVSTAVNAYNFEVTEPYTTIVATLTLPASGDFDLSLFNSCNDSTGNPWDIGRRAWHIGRRAWHIGGEEDPNIYVKYNIGEKTGTYYLAVQVPEDGEYNNETYQLQVELQEPSFTVADTLILFNRERYLNAYGLDATSQMMDMLVEFSGHAKVNGLILQLDQFQNVTDAYEIWDNANVIDGSPYSYQANVQAANNVAFQIRTAMVDFLKNRNARLTSYVVLIGGDDQIPFRRMEIVPDKIEGDLNWQTETEYFTETLIGDQVNSPLDAALMLDYTLTDDHYGDYQERSYEGFWPTFSVGRLIETSDEIEKSIEIFLENDGKITFPPGTAKAAVAGYDFLKDSAQDLCNRLDVQDWGSLDCLLHPPTTFSGLDLYQAFTTADLAAHYGHSNHGQLFTPDDTYLGADTLIGTEINGSLWWAIGCHSGLSLPDSENHPLSLAQALNAQGATYVGNTGWAWGAKGPLTHSELLYDLLAEQLSERDSITIGEALQKAKTEYFWETANNVHGKSEKYVFDYYDAKVLAEATLYGLPMLEVDFPNTVSGATSQSTNEIASMTIVEEVKGLSVPAALNPFTFAPTELDHTLQVYEDNSYYLGKAGDYGTLQGKPSVPIAEELNFNTTFGQGRGVLWLGGNFEVIQNLNPLIIDPVSLNDVPGDEPVFSGTYPLLPVALIGMDEFDGTYYDHLTFHTGQYTGDQNSGIMRLFNDMEFFISTWDSEPADENAPIIGTQTSALDAGILQVTLPIDDESGVYRAYLTYTEKDTIASTGSWQSVQMTPGTGQCVSGQQEHQVSLPIDTEIEYFLQVMDCEGNVAYLFNGESYFTVNPESPINDDFDNALDLNDIAPSHYLSTHGATSNVDDPLVSNCNIDAGAATVWYKYTHTGSTSAIAIDTKGTDYDTFIAIWTGSRTNLSPVACNDNSGGTLQSAMTFQVHDGMTYYIEVGEKTSMDGAVHKDNTK